MVRWPGDLVLALAAYAGTWPEIADEFVTSVRCLTVVDDQVVACEVPGAVHVWPGGRREAGESTAGTAAREVHEETGWLIDESSVRQIGLLHFQHHSPVPTGHRFPHPDFCQIVVTANATEHEADPSTWQDSQGWETRTWLVPLDQAHDLQLTAAELALLPEVGRS
jgi:ADP-ribose pyrophosphatase YjhB (NUDIX family)